MSSLSSRILLIGVLITGVVAADWSSKLWAQQNLEVIYNDRPVQWVMLPVLVGLFVFLLIAQRDWLTPVALGLIAGGWVANIGERAAIGPVTDFIPVPLHIEIYVNLADVAIVLASVLFVGVLARSIAQSLQLRRARKEEPASS